MAEANWYVVHTYSGYENKVKANIEKTIENRHLEDQILEVRVPLQDVVELKNGVRKTVQKKMFPPSVKVVVTEYVPAALITVGDKSMLVNSQLRVLADNDEQAGLVPYVTGLNVQSCEVGGILKSDSEEKDEIAITALKTFEITGILDEVIDINISDTSNIMINYDNRINVKCGSKLNLDRKLRLFKESVKSSSLTENSRGTMDLSESGKSVYTP